MLHLETLTALLSARRCGEGDACCDHHEMIDPVIDVVVAVRGNVRTSGSIVRGSRQWQWQVVTSPSNRKGKPGSSVFDKQ